MIKEIHLLLKDYEPIHTEYQIRNFIIGQEIHFWHRYNQCLREINSRWINLKNNIKNLKILNAQIEKLKKRKRFIFFKKNVSDEIVKKLEVRQSLKNAILQTNKELKIFVKVAMELRKTHSLDSLSIEQKKVLDEQAWHEKAKWMLCLDLYCFGHPSKQTVEFIYKMPKKMKKDLIDFASGTDRNIIRQYLIE